MFSYQTMPIYQMVKAQNSQVYRWLKNNRELEFYIKNQLGRASLSSMLNLAEGSSRFSDKDRRNFLVISRGSIFECASLLEFLEEENELPNGFYSELNQGYEETSKTIYYMIKRLSEK